MTNPYTRHPALTAAAAATIDEVSDGRAVLGLGAGGSAVLALDVARRRPATVLRDAMAIINALTETGTAAYDGIQISFHGSLDFRPARRVPVFLAATGGQMLRLAGAMADGVIMGDAATPGLVQSGLRAVEAAAASVARTRPAVVAWCATAVSHDRSLAVDAVKSVVAVAVFNHRRRLEELGVKLTAEMLSILTRHSWQRTGDSVAALSEVLSDEVVDTFAVVGPPAACVERVRALASQGISQMGVLVRPPRTSSIEEQVRLFSEQVMSRV